MPTTALLAEKTFVTIFSYAMPEEALKVINDVEDGAIPDVAVSAAYAQSVYRFYRAGILTGNDAKGTFGPQTTITRGAAAAIISRMADPSAEIASRSTSSPLSRFLSVSLPTTRVSKRV